MKIKFPMAFLLFVLGSAHAASFDCNKAASPQEKAICATPSLSALDDKQAAAYKAAQAAAADPTQVKAEQRAWLKDTKSCGVDVNCLERAYNTRISQLAPSAAPKSASAEPAAVTAATMPPAAASGPADAASSAASEPAMLQASAAAASAPESAAVAASAPPSLDAAAKVDSEPFWEKAYVKYGAMGIGLIIALAFLYWLFKRVVSGAKKGAALVAQKSDQLKQDLSEKAAQAKEIATEKTTKLAAEMAAKTKEAAATASTKLQEGLNEAAVKSAPHLNTFKGDLADMKSKVSSGWAAADQPAKQKLLNIWAVFTGRQKIIFSATSVIVIALILGVSSGGGGGSSGVSSAKSILNDPALIQRVADRLGPDGYAQCAIGQISISALAARDGNLSKENERMNEVLGLILAKVRFVLLAKGLPQSYLDNLFKFYQRRITTGDQAFDTVATCLKTINGLI